MTKREKTLAGLVGLMVGLMGLGLLIRGVIVQPLRQMDRKTALLRGKLDKLRAERRAYFAAEDLVKLYGARTFADTVDEASARCGEMLTRYLLKCGLRDKDFSRLPVGPRRLRGAQEIGWNVQGQGPLAKVVDWLYALESAPYLHRIENLTLASGEPLGQVRVRFRYLTLVMDPPPDLERKPVKFKLALDTPERRRLDLIVQRDLLRPYVKRPPAPASEPAPSTAPPEGPPPPGPETFRIVSLSEWHGVSEVHVLDTTHQKTARYRVGDALAGGRIVAIDYRPMPMPGKPYLQSFSRVIVRIGDEYWAIERGQTLADKRRLRRDELPENLAGL